MRLAVAREAGLDETTAIAVERGDTSSLIEAQQVALQLADALMTQPGAIPLSLREALARHYRPQQVVELTLDVMKWNYQKVSVALGTDAEITPGRLTDLAFDDKGAPLL